MLKALSQASSFLYLCMEVIFQTQIPPESHTVLLGTDLILNFPYILIDVEGDIEPKPLTRKPDLYIADLDQVPLETTLEVFKNKTKFNPTAKFIFLTKEVTADHVDTLYKILISNVIFISTTTGDISTVYPFKNKAIHDMNREVIVINNCKNMTENKDENHVLFEHKIPEFWNNSMIKFCYSYEPPYAIGHEEEKKGLNLDMFDLIASLVQLEPVWNCLNYPTNGDLYSYTRDSVNSNEICDLNVALYPVDVADFTTPHWFDEIPFFVPAPLQIPRWKYLLKTLTIEIWMFWIFASLFLALSWMATFVILEKKWNPMSILEILWLNIEFFIEKSHDVTKNYLSLRMLFLLIIFQSSLLNMIFKCNFNLVLTGIIFEKPIQSLQDIVDRGMVFGLFELEELENIYEVLGDENEIAKVKYDTCDGGNTCFNRTAYDRDMAIHQGFRNFRFRQNAYLDENGSPLLVKLDMPYKKIGLSGILPLGHPLTPILEKYVLICHAYGFGELITSKYDDGLVTNLPFQLQLMKLTLEHIIAPSALLIGGYVVGVIVFVFEVRKAYRKRRLFSVSVGRNDVRREE